MRRNKLKFWYTKNKKERHSGTQRILFALCLIILAIGLGCGLYYYFIPTVNRLFDKEEKREIVQEEKTIQETVTPQVSATPSSIPELTMESETVSNIIKPRVKVKGIYVSGPVAGSKRLEELIDLIESTELNAMVIDIKNDAGEITYKLDIPLANDINATVKYIPDMEQLVPRLKEKGIYLIARIVAFKDPILAKNRSDLAIRNSDGSIFKDNAGLSWVNPYKKEVWDYLIEIANNAAKLGFDEVQFDYIRFSTDKAMKDVNFGEEATNISKQEIITQFTQYAAENLKPLGVSISADVFGAILSSKTDAQTVGQNYVEMSKYLDVICPMVYPSHYANGAYNVEYPDLEPYKIISGAMDESKDALAVFSSSGESAIVRPWLQDFTATWLKNYVKYDADKIRAQIQAVYDAGYEEWILWNGSNRYTKEGLLLE